MDNREEEMMRLYKERKELVLRRYHELDGNVFELAEWYNNEYRDNSLMVWVGKEREESVAEYYKTSNFNFSETLKWYEEQYKNDIDLGDAKEFIEGALATYNLPRNAPEQSVVDEVAKYNLAPSEVMANYIPSKEKSKGCMITILIMITATSLTSLLFL